MHTLEKLQSALDALNTERARIAGEGWYLQNCWLVQVKPGGNARTDRKYWQARSRQAIFDGKMLKHLKPDEVEDYKAAIARGRQLKQIDRQIEKLVQQLEQLSATTEPSKDTSPRQMLTPAETLREQRREPPFGYACGTPRANAVPYGGKPACRAVSPQRTGSPTPLLKGEGSITPPFPSTEGGLGGLGLPYPSSIESTVGFTDLTEQERLVKEVIAKSQALRASLRQSVAVGKLLGARIINLRSGHPHVD